MNLVVGRHLSHAAAQNRGYMGQLVDLDSSSPQFVFTRRVPGPVRRLQATVSSRGHLVLQWLPPAGGCAARYRIESTREGKHYKLIGETDTEWFCVHNVPQRESIFYRVVAVNNRGIGRCKLLWFCQRRGGNKSLLMPIVPLPGVRLNICEFIPE